MWSSSDDRLVEVAVDAAGVAGGQTYTYHVPATLGTVVAGDVVLVEYGRREAIGVVMDGTPERPEQATKPLLGKVRADGPVLPELQVRLMRWIAEHYLAPPAMVIRQMLPPGMLERVRLVATAVVGAGGGSTREAQVATDGTDGADNASSASEADETAIPALGLVPAGDPRTEALIAQIASAGDAGIAVTELSSDENRATTLRRLRGAQADGRIALEWRLVPAGARPRQQRVASTTETGRAIAAHLAAGAPTEGRRLGPRQRALLLELAGLEPGTAVPAAQLAARHGAASLTGLARRGLIDLGAAVRERRPPEGMGAIHRGGVARGARPAGSDLTADQLMVVERVQALIGDRLHAGILLEGATASGKTAVYAESVAAALEAGRGAILLVPEVSMVAPLADRLGIELGVEVALVHSALSDGERGDEWRRIRAGEVRVVIGTRLAVLAPMADVGLVIVDEEHDPAYKSDRTPRFQARDTALALGRIAEAPVILGSATPDVASLGRARRGDLEHHRLTDRATGAGVHVEVVDLRAELAGGNAGMLSRALLEALQALDRDAGDRAILVINRRGSASVVLCRDCGYVQICPECHRPLVFHASVMALRCHHCGATAPIARRCPSCDSPRIRYLGGGTERVEREVGVRLPGVRVGRLDRDVVERKGAAAKVIDDLAEGRIDVLVGTSLVTKGLDVPEVVLVGVVSADIALNLPDERAEERTYQLLAQAVGRAGRGSRPGRAIIQSYQPEHPAIRAVSDGDPRAFIEAQLEQRRLFGSPPFGSLVKLTIALEDRTAAEDEAKRFAAELRDRARALDPDDPRGPATVLGPVPAYIARRGGRWRFHLVLRGRDPVSVLGGDPGAPWSVDIDPESLL